jgi:RecA/RadA recombinase
VPPAPGAHDGPVVGHQAHLRAIDAVREATTAGKGGLLAIAGPAGTGKTELARSAMAQAVEAGFVAAWSSCRIDGGSPPLSPWPEILSQLGVEAGAALLDRRASTGVDPERFKRFRAVAASLARASEHAPAIVVLDDAHEAGTEVLVLARCVARAARQAHVLVVVAYREPADDTGELAGALRDLAAEGTVLTLQPRDEGANGGSPRPEGPPDGQAGPERFAELQGATVEMSLSVARAWVDGYAYESAADLLRWTVDSHERRGENVPPRLMVELALAEARAGRLRAARDSFRRAADVATSQARPDVEVLAESAIGLGGIWVLEHREPPAMEQFHRLLRHAQDALGDRRYDLRLRIAVRAAAEAVYAGTGSVGAVRAAVEQVRANADRNAIAESLSLLHHTLLGPEFADERLELANELVDVASAAGDSVLLLMGELWRTVDLFLLGDPAAETSLAELREHAEVLRVRAVRFVVAAFDVMLALRQGRVEDAELAAAQCLKTGLEVGDADAPNYYGAQLLAVRWLQGRSDEILPVARDLAHSVGLVALDRAYQAAHAALAADAGPAHAPEAQRVLDRLLAGGLAALTSSSNWLVTFFTTTEAAALLGDAAAAAGMYEALLPYARLPVMASIGVVCFGSVERSLGVAARAARRTDEAVGHLERAVEACARLGNRPVEEMSRADLAITLIARNEPGDPERAAGLLAQATGALRALGLEARAARVEDEAERART